MITSEKHFAVHIEDAWRKYRDQVFRRTIPEYQERDCALCFYAGMMEAFLMVSKISDQGDEEKAAAEIENWRHALKSVSLAKNEQGRSL